MGWKGTSEGSSSGFHVFQLRAALTPGEELREEAEAWMLPFDA